MLPWGVVINCKTLWRYFSAAAAISNRLEAYSHLWITNLKSHICIFQLSFTPISCTSCVERELSRRKTFPCPICETLVKRVTLSTRTLDDVQCEKDTSWRRRILKVWVIYNYHVWKSGFSWLLIHSEEDLTMGFLHYAIFMLEDTTSQRRIFQLFWNTTII